MRPKLQKMVSMRVHLPDNSWLEEPRIGENCVLRPELQSRIQPFLDSVAEASRALLMLDYDGTLAPFNIERDRAFPGYELVQTLQEIVRDGHTRVVIVSGRDASELIRLLRIQPMPELWGLHGFQRREPDGTYQLAQLEKNHLDALFDARRWLEYQRLLPCAEFKTGSIAVHWRGREEREQADIRMRVLLGWERLADVAGLQILEFDGGLEIRVPGPDKGNVVRQLLAEMRANAPAAYLGDDATDERAFRELRGRGLTVLVRSQWRPTAAQLWMESPSDVSDFLSQWLDACRKSRARSSARAVALSR